MITESITVRAGVESFISGYTLKPKHSRYRMLHWLYRKLNIKTMQPSYKYRIAYQDPFNTAL